jgi:processive 1,2-diacylglycerol beta-glucosyltransferase
MAARLRAQIETLPAAHAGSIKVLGYTSEVDALFEACDVAVSKAGGLTCAEALVKRVPLVIYRPTPGQEVANAEFLEAGGAAVRAGTIDEVAARIEHWLADPAAREQARAAAGRLAKPAAAETIARRVLEGARAPAANPGWMNQSA